MNHPPSASGAADQALASETFDTRGGNRLERLIFNFRLWVLLFCAVVSSVLAWQASKIQVNASFEDMVPRTHPFILNYFANQAELNGLGNTLRIAVENPSGTIFEPKYLETLAQINDRAFLIPGVERSWLQSLWTPLVRWTEVTEDGFSGGPVMPPTYDGSPGSIAELRRNVLRSGIVGSLVSNDFRSSMLIVPLMSADPSTGLTLDYRKLAETVERDIRSHFEQNAHVKIHVVGFAKLAGDLLEGLEKVMTFFLVSVVVAAAVLYGYTRCLRSTLLVLGCSGLAVVWQLGIVRMLGHSLDPYSILVPFLVFAIGVSHGAQKMNGIMQDIGRGASRYAAARFTFRRLFLAGLTALAADAVGFAVLMLVDIPVIGRLALAASIGVAGLVFTNLVLLPVLLSYVGVSAEAARRTLKEDKGGNARPDRVVRFLGALTRPQAAVPVLALTAVFALGSLLVSRHLQVGDLDPGAPELRPESRYNRDVAYIGEHFGLSNDVFAVIVKAPPDGCTDYATMVKTDRLTALLAQTEGVQATQSLANRVRLYTSGSFEGNPKWYSISNDPDMLRPAIAAEAALTTTLMNADCSVFPVVAYLRDHKAHTLSHVTDVVQRFAAENNTSDVQFLLVAGSAGIDAATNIVVEESNRKMLLYVYAAVVVLCFITFRNWRAVVVAVVPLVVTSVFCEALMVVLGIGVKVATLPVVALGVGIGVDYALYLVSVQLALQRGGHDLRSAVETSVKFTGKVVALVGITLAAGVVTWAWSPIKFQADIGLLLAFMFIWNMLGALVLTPALSCFMLRDIGAKAPIHSTQGGRAKEALG